MFSIVHSYSSLFSANCLRLETRYVYWAEPWLKRLVVPQHLIAEARVQSRPVHAEFVVDKAAVEQVSLRLLGVSRQYASFL